MKKEFKLVSASVIGLVCASLMTPSFAVTAVRSLGGAGTYAGTTAAAQSATTARAGSVRVGGSTRTSATSSAALRTPSTRSATAPRLSIGKYLSANSSLGTGGKVELSNTVNSSVNELNTKYDELEQTVKNFDIDGLRAEVDALTDAEIALSYDESKGVLTIEHAGHTDTVSIFNREEADQIINDLIASEVSKVQEEIAAVKKQIGNLDIPDSVTYSAGDGVTIGEDNKISANIASGDLINITTDEQGKKSVNAIIGALTGSFVDGLAKTSDVTDYVTGYAIPKPGAGQCNKPSSTCVLSVNNNGDLYWLELVDTEPAPDGE